MLSEKIVVIDDDPMSVECLEMFLKEYEIIAFSTGEEALEFLKKPNEINLVLLDVRLPGMDGVSVLNEIKEMGKDIAVIIMTAYGSMDIAVQSLRYHADDFMEKPFVLEELKDKIRKILKKRFDAMRYAGKEEDQIERIKRFVERNYKDVSLAVIANEMCKSVKYISRMFNRECNISFRDYKINVKMDMAKSLLETSRLGVGEISAKLGYQNPESFMRVFKRVTKLTPMQYRKSVKK